jgi:hypothetical protein
MGERLQNIQRHLYEIHRHGEPAKLKVREGLKDMLVDQCKLLERELVQAPVAEQADAPALKAGGH